jgi:hypothetical protein
VRSLFLTLALLAAGVATAQVRHDVLVLYTDSAIATAGIESLNAQTDANLSWTNQAYVNSGVNLEVVAVAKLRSPLQETGDIIQTQTALYSSPEVQALRAQYYADIVVLITNHTTGYDGVGRLWYGFSGSTITFLDAHATIRWNKFTARTLAHELGHAQGLAHNREAEGGGVSGQYNYGYRRCVTGGFADIMSNLCTGVTAIHQFSNPRLTFNGMPTGVDPAVNPATAADASRALNEAASLVGNYRNPPVNPPPPPPPPPATAPNAPSNLTAAQMSKNAITLRWTDNSTDETGFVVERSVDGVTYKVRKTTAVNAVLHNDTVQATVLYYYRVRAVNASGASAYSNVVSFATTL